MARLVVRERVNVVRISQMLRDAGLEARRMVRSIVVLISLREVSSIYRLKNYTLSVGFKGPCAFYTNLYGRCGWWFRSLISRCIHKGKFRLHQRSVNIKQQLRIQSGGLVKSGWRLLG